MKLKRASIFTKIVIAALAVYALISLADLQAKVTEAMTERQQLQQQLQQLSQENAELEYEIAHSDDDETIENIARDKLGLVRPGEKIFYDISN